MEKPKSDNVTYRFIAFSMITGNSLSYAATPFDAINIAISRLYLPDSDFIECLDCVDNGHKIWNRETPLYRARESNNTVFRGPGYKYSRPPINLESM